MEMFGRCGYEPVSGPMELNTMGKWFGVTAPRLHKDYREDLDEYMLARTMPTRGGHDRRRNEI